MHPFYRKCMWWLVALGVIIIYTLVSNAPDNYESIDVYETQDEKWVREQEADRKDIEKSLKRNIEEYNKGK